MKANKVSSFIQKYTMVLALVLVTAFFAIRTGGKTLFPGNINNLIAQNGYVFVLAAGMLLCILTGGNIDLSVGSVVCFTAAIGCVMMDRGANMWLAVLAMLLVGLAIGAFQGFWIAKVHVPAFIATLSGMYAFRGFSNVVLQGYQVSVNNEAFLNIFGGGANCYVPDFIRQMMGPRASRTSPAWWWASRWRSSTRASPCARSWSRRSWASTSPFPPRRSPRRSSARWCCG